MAGLPILSIIVFLPTVAAIVILLLKGDEEGVAKASRNIAFAATMIDFALSLRLWGAFDPASADFQFVESASWLGGGITYKMG
ncbi:MAG TPA: hypothetical protein VEU06_00770, partial [Micropepsaceae bacterium]|nr:hypothetical protein [Micropepsaceae bacterium]